MKLTIKKINVIEDLSTWFKYAEPEGGEKQWKEGRSAMEFARYMTSSEGNMPSEILSYLNLIGFTDENYICYPEEVTPYDPKELGKGSGRHHDGLLVSKNYLVGIEAKVSESFDSSFQDKMSSAKKNKDNGENMKKRLFNSIKMIKPDYNDSTLDSAKHLMYQLVSGTVGTIIESKEKEISKAAFLIIEFVGDVEKETDYSKKIQANQKAYDEYLSFLSLDNKEDKDRYIDVDNGNIRLWINKIKITVKKENYKYNIANN